MSSSQKNPIYIGTAGWNIPKSFFSSFGNKGTHLERYSAVLNAVEINTSFYREHKARTYEKWAQVTPDDFKFSVKLWRHFTHEQRLAIDSEAIKNNLSAISCLQEKWGCLLIQLPPSLALNTNVATDFFGKVRDCYSGPIAFEPRHSSWAGRTGLELLDKFDISKVLADPEPCPMDSAKKPRLLYCRLHGQPEVYKSNYEIDSLKKWATPLQQTKNEGRSAWCIFDNTTFGFATKNALEMSHIVLIN